MNWPYLHTLVNHFPIVLTVVGAAVLLLALIVRRRGVWLYAVATLTLAGLSVYPAYVTGDEASDALRNTWYVVRSMVREHSQSADWALVTVLIMGVVSAYAWWRLLKRDIGALPPVWLRWVVALLTALALSVVVRTAVLGGRIVHESPRLQNPPPGMGAATPATPGG